MLVTESDSLQWEKWRHLTIKFSLELHASFPWSPLIWKTCTSLQRPTLPRVLAGFHPSCLGPSCYFFIHAHLQTLLLKWIILFLFWPGHTACGILVAWAGTEPEPRQWRHKVLTSGPPGNSHQMDHPFFFLNKFIYLFIFGYIGSSLLWWAFSSCGEQGFLFIVVCGLLIAVVSLVAEHGL